MAKSQLEIVLIDDGSDVPTETVRGPSPADVERASTSVPASPRSDRKESDTAVPAGPRARRAGPDQGGPDRQSAAHPSVADSMGRILEAAGRSMNLGPLVESVKAATTFSKEFAAGLDARLPKPERQTPVPISTRVSGPSAASAGSSAASLAGALAGPAAVAAAGLGGVAAASDQIIRAFGSIQAGTRALVLSMREQVSLLAPYSVQVSSATAATELQREASMMARASRLGPAVARFENSRSQMESSMTRVGTNGYEILFSIWNRIEPFAKDVTSLAESMSILATKLEDKTNVISGAAKTLTVDPQTEVMFRLFNKVAGDVKKIVANTRKESETEEIKSFNEQFMELGRNMTERLYGEHPDPTLTRGVVARRN